MEELSTPDESVVTLDSSNLSEISFSANPQILVIGCGGAGNNCVNQLHKLDIKGAQTIAINTDKQHLEMIEADKKILIGTQVTNGMGVGGDPRIAMKCVDVSRPVLDEILCEAELVFIIAGMGGGTGTGVAPLIAEIAKSHGSIVVGIATTPFKMERLRMRVAQVGLIHLKKHANSLIMVDNNKLLKIAPKLPMQDAFKVIDNLIAEIVHGITETITQPSLINLDFADVKAIMGNGGVATMLFGEGTTANPETIIKNALKNPLLDTNCKGAVGALIHITGGDKMSLQIVQDITAGITHRLDANANIIMGASVKPELGKRVKVLTIMTGLKPPKMLCPMDDEIRDPVRRRIPRIHGGSSQDTDLEPFDDYKMPPTK
ncbi:MAG: cell division protein FtsZ [Thermoplasmata archaeon]|nr:MAG: cell division protein FtsZ [Thermoplasmata archaeon]